MKSLFIFLFCVASGISLGVLAAVGVINSPAILLAASVGGIYGAVLGIVSSPLFVWQRDHPGIFAILVVCFVVSLPAAIVAGFTANTHLAILLIALPILSTFYLLVRRVPADEGELLGIKTIYIVPALCVIFGVAVAYHREVQGLPDDTSSLIEMMGSNDEEVHRAAANKLRMRGKEPFLNAIKNENPDIRARAAHFLGLWKDPSVKDALIQAAKDPDPYVRMWVAFSLGEIGDPDVLPTLNELMKDQDEKVRRHSKEAIERIRRHPK